MEAASRTDDRSLDERAERLIAMKRAVPPSRMLDYGMTADDAARLSTLAPEEGRDWSDLAEALARRHLAEAENYAARRQAALCRQERERAAAAFNIGQLAFNRDNARKRHLYSLASECLATNAQDPGCDYKRLMLPAEDGKHLFGWDFPVRDSIGAAVMFGGLSGWGASFFGVARALTACGIRVILAEAPGQGETRLVSGFHLSRETLSHAMRFVELATAAGRPVGLIGFSFGGLLAAHLAAAAPGIAALCTNGSPVRIGAVEHPAEREQFAAAFGAEGSELIQRIAKFNFDASKEMLHCPVLSLEGGADFLVPPGTWRGFFEGREEAVLARVWSDGAHTLYNHAAERNALIGAWLSDCFRQSTEK